ncbi:MAG: hypothetical protein H6831_00535 [Planctomycetes bacterium]|nr:hypothetical protein [Planctomycetota bacterium]
MFRLTVKRHDRYQIELKVTYPLPGGAKKRDYEFDLYLFAPLNLGVRRENYSKAQFYADLQSYIRLTTPEVALGEFVEGEGSPHAKLRAVIEATSFSEAKGPPESYERTVKLYCSMLKSAVRDECWAILQVADAAERDARVARFVEDLQRICRAYRALRERVELPGVSERAVDVYHFGDEWLSLLVEDRGYHLLEDLRELGPTTEARGALRRFVEGEAAYRTARGYPSVVDGAGDNELPVFRRSVLKKYMASILFLQTEVSAGGALLRETLFGIAAALAMIFATAVAFATQSIYGALTPAFFVALVVSYIFKDRLKELLRTYFQKRMRGFLFDQRTRVRDSDQSPVGECRESFDFVDERRLPAAVRELRNSHHLTKIESRYTGEQIMVYRKRVHLDARAVHATFPDYDVPGITDIMRFRVSEFLSRMDDPTKELFVMDDEGYQRIKGARVYHLNFVLNLRGDGRQDLRRYRVVLTRKGIKRIEAVGVRP